MVPLGPDVAPPAGVSDVGIKAIQCADYTLETRQVRNWRWLMPRQVLPPRAIEHRRNEARVEHLGGRLFNSLPGRDFL